MRRPAIAMMVAAAALLLAAGTARAAGAADDGIARCRSEAHRGLTAACETALETRPHDPELHALLGEAYFTSGFYGEGLRSLHAAIDASGGAADYRYRFAGFAALINEFTQATDELERVVAARPKDVRAWALLAVCYRFMKDDARALHAGRQAAALGDAAEAYALAARYAAGDGLVRDAREEQRWLRRAANRGYVAAMQDLAALYANGRPGIPPDPARQHYWEEALRRAVN